MPTAVITRASASPRTNPFATTKSASVRNSARPEITRRNFSLAAEKVALLHSLRSGEKNWFAMCSDFREAGQHWLNIRAEWKEQRINAGKWATENAPIKLRWLDRYGEFVRRWDEFPESWKWSEALPYAPERRPGLWGAFDLMDAKARFGTYSEARKRGFRVGSENRIVGPFPPIERNRGSEQNPIRLTQTATLLQGDA